jgi:tetratricopeptide (TPR) repeat protein
LQATKPVNVQHMAISETLFQSLVDLKKHLSTTRKLCRCRSRQASADQSDRSIAYSLKFSNFVGDKVGEGRAYGNIGNALGEMGRFEEELEYHKKDLEIAQQTGESRPIRLQHFSSIEFSGVFAGDKAGEGRAYGNIGNALDSLGQFEEALGYHKKNLEIAPLTGELTTNSIAASLIR